MYAEVGLLKGLSLCAPRSGVWLPLHCQHAKVPCCARCACDGFLKIRLKTSLGRRSPSPTASDISHNKSQVAVMIGYGYEYAVETGLRLRALGSSGRPDFVFSLARESLLSTTGREELSLKRETNLDS
jgi:hypothetical protein